MELFNIDYDKEENLNVLFKVDKDFKTLYCSVSGNIKDGSLGNSTADYLFGKISQYYFQTNAFILILDLTDLIYSFGDRLRKSINFYNQIGRDDEEKKQPVILILSNKCNVGVSSLIEWIKPESLFVEKTFESAISKSEELFKQLMED